MLLPWIHTQEIKLIYEISLKLSLITWLIVSHCHYLVNNCIRAHYIEIIIMKRGTGREEGHCISPFSASKDIEFNINYILMGWQIKDIPKVFWSLLYLL